MMPGDDGHGCGPGLRVPGQLGLLLAPHRHAASPHRDTRLMAAVITGLVRKAEAENDC